VEKSCENGKVPGLYRGDNVFVAIVFPTENSELGVESGVALEGLPSHS